MIQRINIFGVQVSVTTIQDAPKLITSFKGRKSGYICLSDAYVIVTATKNKKLNEARLQRGILISSGFIAGAALFGVFGAFVIFFTGDGEALNLNVWKDPSGNGAQITAIIAFIGLLAYFVWESFRAKEDQD